MKMYDGTVIDTNTSPDIVVDDNDDWVKQCETISPECAIDRKKWHLFFMNEYYPLQTHDLERIWYLCAKYGRLDVMKELHRRNVDGCTSKTMDTACFFNYLKIVKWLHENHKGCTKYAMNHAAENGYLDILQWLHKNRKEGCTTDAMDGAAKNGHLKIIKWLHKNRKEGCTSWAMVYAVENGHLDIVQWLDKNKSESISKEYTTYILKSAIENNHLQIVEWLHTNDYKFTNELFVYACISNHFDIVVWLVEHGYKEVIYEDELKEYSVCNMIVDYLHNHDLVNK